MNKKDLKNYLNDNYQGCKSFLENVIYPIFGKDHLNDDSDTELLDAEPEKRALASEIGISSIKDLGYIDIGVDRLFFFDLTVSDRVVMQRNRVNIQRVIRNTIGYYTSAFMVFHYDDDIRWDWRFTFCRKGGSDKESTDTKRYTFLLGPDQSCTTAAENFMKLYDKRDTIEIKDIENAFDVEALSNEFFDKYLGFYASFVKFITGRPTTKETGEHKITKTEFLNVIQKMDRLGLHDELNQFEKVFGGDEKAANDYIKKMMGRITFLHYLQKKRWLCNDLHYMQTLFEKHNQDQNDFLERILEPLFFGVLNTGIYDESHEKTHNQINEETYQCRKAFWEKHNQQAESNFNLTTWDITLLDEWKELPYLNGGLFEDDTFDRMRVRFPAEMFKQLFDFFAQYNFTIDENDPNDAEVGIDPEMLGKIFENLLEDNKDKGAFYTPKEIVQYMCQECLITYLSEKCGKENEVTLRKFIKDPIETGVPNINNLFEAIKDVKICDPAIGSGAFPMGLLNILYRCHIALGEISSPVKIKKHIIQNNIYGVDIERGAVDIARLRFWLTLVVDEDTPEPLPNLDYKIMQGNSLLESFEKIDLSNITKLSTMQIYEPERDIFGNIIDRQIKITYTDRNDFNLNEALNNFYNPTLAHDEKTKLKEKINEYVREQLLYNIDLRTEPYAKIINDLSEQSKLTNAQEKKLNEIKKEYNKYIIARKNIEEMSMQNDKFFLWHTWFSDVFNRPNGCNGFDIVIGNPPYGAKLTTDDKKIIKQIYTSAKTIPNTQKGSLDTFSLFIELGFNLCAITGNSMFIVPLSVTASDSMSGLHYLLLNNCEIINISSYGDRPKRVFESAEQQVSIIGFKRTNDKTKQLLTTHINKRYSDDSLWILLDNLNFVDAKDFVKNGRIPKIGTKTEQSILSKLSLIKTTLGNLISDEGDPIYYRKAGGRYYKIITKETTDSSAEDSIYVSSHYQNLVGACLSSSLFYWFWLINSDWHNLRMSELQMFPLPYEDFTNMDLDLIKSTYDNYLKELYNNSKTTKTGLRCFFARKSKKTIDRIDDIIGPLYGLTQDEIEFIKNYEIEFRSNED